MYFSEHSFQAPELNVAWEEACVELADEVLHEQETQNGNRPDEAGELAPLEALRVWSFHSPVVVMGRASRIGEEVCLERCEADGVPVLRRASGGSTIVAGPGCLMVSVQISYTKRPTWRSLDIAHREVMSRTKEAVVAALREFGITKKIALQGTCDLTDGPYKFSGNALRCKRHAMIYHGTLLLDMPLEWIERYLLEPPRQPEYRERRSHRSFVRNLLQDSSVDRLAFERELGRQLQSTWQADQPWENYPYQDKLADWVDQLMQTRYANPAWHRER
ncbi:Lipoate-protein ligase LplJ [Pirellula sp. SH-Sr6A]|uniref:lipoate--protein ligase family protein n=1 Tax=Pirellula sp. SH-Sr6A TaxID=1632865 RepID=UPI00078C7FB9|nr:lipoate--protein ligase family protein [Pirellula sp. SH-Sr6A]AMV32987.1 Lipoate-protein ligase LplJ [Pirellula sp. SH-Sr6A]